MSNSEKKTWKEVVADLKQQRDELKLQAHLFKAEAKDEWERTEEQWNKLQADLKPVTDATKEAAGDVAAATSMLAQTLKDSYAKIKDSAS